MPASQLIVHMRFGNFKIQSSNLFLGDFLAFLVSERSRQRISVRVPFSALDLDSAGFLISTCRLSVTNSHHALQPEVDQKRKIEDYWRHFAVVITHNDNFSFYNQTPRKFDTMPSTDERIQLITEVHLAVIYMVLTDHE
jgi:hypothetical protein